METNNEKLNNTTEKAKPPSDPNAKYAVELIAVDGSTVTFSGSKKKVTKNIRDAILSGKISGNETIKVQYRPIAGTSDYYETDITNFQQLNSHRNMPKILLSNLIVLVVIVILVLYVRGCVGSSRESVNAKAPNVVLPTTNTSQDGIPVYDADIPAKFTDSVAFIEIVSDEIYKQENSTILRSIFPGRLFGGEVIYLNGASEWNIMAQKYVGGGEKVYWIRAATHEGSIVYKEKLDQILYSIVGRPVDGICGYFVDRKGPGGLYGQSEFHNYAMGQFKPFCISVRK